MDHIFTWFDWKTLLQVIVEPIFIRRMFAKSCNMLFVGKSTFYNVWWTLTKNNFPSSHRKFSISRGNFKSCSEKNSKIQKNIVRVVRCFPLNFAKTFRNVFCSIPVKRCFCINLIFKTNLMCLISFKNTYCHVHFNKNTGFCIFDVWIEDLATILRKPLFFEHPQWLFYG